MRCLSLLFVSLSLTFGSAAQGQETCRTCVAQFNLDAARWQCLLRQRPALEREATARVFLQLDAHTCNPRSRTRQGTSVLLVRETVEEARASPVYVLSKRQLQCLAEKSSRVRRMGGRFIFDFASICGS